MRPIPELPAQADLIGSDGSRATIQVVDVSVGGLALAKTGVLDLAEAGRRLSLHLALGRYGEHEVGVEVRWAAEALVGVQYVELGPAATTAVRRYVAELLERGAHS
jgi:hypothetical protein